MKLDYKTEREDLVNWVKDQLIGANLPDDFLTIPNPFQLYSTGFLFPLIEGHDEYEASEEGVDEELNPTDSPKRRKVQPPSSLGFSFYVSEPSTAIRMLCSAKSYTEEKGAGGALKRIWKKSSLEPQDIEYPFHIYPGFCHEVVVFSGKGSLGVVARPHGDGQIVTVSLTNTQKLVASNSNDPKRDEAAHALFEVELKCIVDSTKVSDYPSVDIALLTDEEQELELRYRNEKVYAIGHGVACDWYINESSELEIYSDFMPIVEIPKVSADIPALDKHTTCFHFLSQTDNNEELFRALERFIDSYRDWIDAQAENAEYESEFKAAADRLVSRMTEAKSRMHQGLDLLKSDPQVLKAFCMANEAMLMQMLSAKGASYDSEVAKNLGWRPFQLAFVLLSLESAISERSHFRDIVDLIWFPTGGGKTEAYLGLIAIIFLYRRMKWSASGGGTVALMRYTLRLLTSQQFMRASKVIFALELIRMRYAQEFGDEPFSLGLWLGGSISPNSLFDAKRSIEEEKYSRFVLTECPWCNSPFQKNSYHCSEHDFYYSCCNESCEFGRDENNRLPINVVDEVLYEKPPTLIIATVDKFARLAWDEKAAVFFGIGNNRPPEIIIQDELHLISGALGSIVGLYEVGIETALNVRGVSPKYIASTATVRNAKEQVSALYGRSMSVFPPAGLRHDDSYFAKTVPLEKEPGRLYVGYLAFEKRANKAVEDLAGAILQAPTKCFHEKPDYMDAWWTLISYYTTIKALGNGYTNFRSGVKRYSSMLNEKNCREDLGLPELEIPSADDSRGRIPPELEGNESLKKIWRAYYPQRDLSLRSLTSKQSAQQNADVFEALKDSYDKQSRVDVLLATNMISVGLDVERLTMMIVNGQPLTTAEYIQASSRVGRGDIPGVVFVNYHKSQARSLSHYENFKPYHQSFYRHVEPTSITPFTFQARKRALHAALIIALRHGKIGLTANKDIEHFDSTNETVQALIRAFKRRVHLACASPKETDLSEKNIDKLLNELQEEVERCKIQHLNLRYHSRDNSSESILCSFDNPRDRGLWKTLNSMRNVESSALLKLQVPEEG